MSERVVDFNRELDGERNNYIVQVNESNVRAKEKIRLALQTITETVREQDEQLERMRNRAI
eukprot:3681196-Karenia_brevis.AAC.1